MRRFRLAGDALLHRPGTSRPAWTEAGTEVANGRVPDEVYELARQHFTEKELVDLTLAIVAINGWNRLAISFRSVPGTYQPAAFEAAPYRQAR